MTNIRAFASLQYPSYNLASMFLPILVDTSLQATSSQIAGIVMILSFSPTLCSEEYLAKAFWIPTSRHHLALFERLLVSKFCFTASGWSFACTWRYIASMSHQSSLGVMIQYFRRVYSFFPWWTPQILLLHDRRCFTGECASTTRDSYKVALASRLSWESWVSG